MKFSVFLNLRKDRAVCEVGGVGFDDELFGVVRVAEDGCFNES